MGQRGISEAKEDIFTGETGLDVQRIREVRGDGS